MARSDSMSDLLAFFNLENEDVEDITFTNEGDLSIVHVLLRADYPPCPACDNTSVLIKGYELKVITYSALSDRKCILHYRARRYRCPVCGRTYYEHNPFSFRKMKISAKTVMEVLDGLKSQSATFSSVARQHYISPTTAASLFDQHVMMPRLPLPELMCWDEAYAFNHQGEKSKYVFTILDFTSQEPVDLLPSRKKEYLTSYFLNIPSSERKQVKMIATDMYKEYRYVIRSIFPNAIHCVDHYHVSQDVSRKLDKVRIRIMKSVPKYIDDTRSETDEYYLLKKFNWLIFKRNDTKEKDGKLLFDPSRERRMNHKLSRLLNYYDLRNLIEAIHPDLKAAWQLKDDLVDFYDENNCDTAAEALNTLIQKFFRSGIPEMIEAGKTLRSWQNEIVNSFIVVGNRYKVDMETGQVVVSAQKLNNGLMENRNSILKTIKKNANGYTNWDRFRNRCLYVLRKDARPLLNPVDKK